MKFSHPLKLKNSRKSYCQLFQEGCFQAASLFALAWSVGFAVVFVPAGMGVRESVLVVLLSQLISSGDAASAALLSRLWWMAIEAIYVMLSIR